MRENIQSLPMSEVAVFAENLAKNLFMLPLLRSMEAINVQALRLIRLFGNRTSKRVTPSVGPEQEYFFVDREKYLQRKDLIFIGRTLFGAMPPKGQEMDDHYFGSIRERIASYMSCLLYTSYFICCFSLFRHRTTPHFLIPLRKLFHQNISKIRFYTYA